LVGENKRNREKREIYKNKGGNNKNREKVKTNFLKLFDLKQK